MLVRNLSSPERLRSGLRQRYAGCGKLVGQQSKIVDRSGVDRRRGLQVFEKRAHSPNN